MSLGLTERVAHSLVHPPKAVAGDRVAVVSPSFAAPAVAPGVHEQAMRRLTELTGLVPVEYPTTRRLDATAADRAADLNAAFGDPSIRAVLGDHRRRRPDHGHPPPGRGPGATRPQAVPGVQRQRQPAELALGARVASFHGGSTQVQIGPGPAVDDVHLRSLRAALLDGGRLEITEPGESEDVGLHWDDPAALTSFGDREPTEPWTWAGPARSVTGPTWGGCIEVLQWVLTAGRFPADPGVLEGGVLLLEASEDLIPASEFGYILRSLGERGLVAAVDAVVVSRPPTSSHDVRPSAETRAGLRAAQRDVAIETVRRYHPEAVVVVGVPFGHTRPQWVLPHGGELTVDGIEQRVWADYD